MVMDATIGSLAHVFLARSGNAHHETVSIGTRPNVYKAALTKVVSEGGNPPFRSCSAAFPHSPRSFSAALPHSSRSFSAAFPHSSRSFPAQLPQLFRTAPAAFPDGGTPMSRASPCAGQLNKKRTIRPPSVPQKHHPPSRLWEAFYAGSDFVFFFSLFPPPMVQSDFFFFIQYDAVSYDLVFGRCRCSRR